MKKTAVVLLLSTIVAAPAFADNSGWYAGLTAGTSRSSTPNGTTLTDSSKTVGSVLGGYQFDNNWGVEGEYAGAGEITDISGMNSKAYAWSLKAIGTLPLSDVFGLYGKLGYANTKTTVSDPRAAYSGATRSAVTYGLGLKYAATSAVDIRLGWDRYGAAINNVLIGKDDYHSNIYSVGVVYKF